MSDLELSRSPILHPFPSATHALPPTSSLRAAVRRLETFHAPSRPRSSTPGELLALLQLRDRLPALRDQDVLSRHWGAWYADVAQKVFPDLDQALFEGRLNGNVCLTWTTDEEEEVRGEVEEEMAVCTSAMTCAPRTWIVFGDGGGAGRRVWIRLNADMLLLDAQKTLTDLISVLVHEMVVGFVLFSGQVRFLLHTITPPPGFILHSFPSPNPPPPFSFPVPLPKLTFPKHAYLILLTGTSPFTPPPAARAHAHYHHHHRDDEREELFARAITAVNGALMRSTGFGVEVER